MELQTEARQDAWIGAAIGSAAAISVAGLLGAAREHVGPTNGALALALVVVLAATVGGRMAGLATAVVATASFNFFLVPPYLTLRVDKGQDLVAVCLLGLVGLVVGIGAEHRGITKARVADDIGAIHALSRMTELVTNQAPREEQWSELQRDLSAVIGATESTYFETPVPGDVASLPLLDSHGSVFRSEGRHTTPGAIHRLLHTRRGLTLPTEGVAIPVRSGGRELGRIAVTTSPNIGSTREHRAAAVAIVNLWALSTISDHIITQQAV